VEGGGALQILEVTVTHPVPGAAVQGTLVYQIGGASTFIILGDQQPGLDLDETPSVEAQPTPAPGSSPGAAETVAPSGRIVSAPSATAAPAGTATVRPVPAPAGAAAAAALAPQPPLPSPFDAPIETPSETGAADDGGSGPRESAAPAVAAQPVVSIRDLRDEMKSLIGIAGLGGAVILATCAVWSLRRQPSAS
jgi:hypothetical protein